MKILDIKRAAKLRHKTLRDVAANTVNDITKEKGVAPSTITIHAKGNPSLRVLYAIAEAIGCDITELFFAEKEEATQEEQKKTKKQRAELRCPHCGKPLHISAKKA